MRFTQVKITSTDPETLVSFYETALGCRKVLPRTVLDETAARAIGVTGVTPSITVLQLPGHEDGGPTLELISFDGKPPDGWAHGPGGGQLAFAVEDVDEAVAAVIAAGGTMLGEVVDWTAPTGNVVRFVFLRDPEGNIIDLFGKARNRPEPDNQASGRVI